MKHTVFALALSIAILLAGAGAAVAATMIGLLPGPTPTVAWSAVDQDYRTYFTDCGPILIDQSGMDESPRYYRWIKGLQNKGWHGIAGDGVEAIYPPGC